MARASVFVLVAGCVATGEIPPRTVEAGAPAPGGVVDPPEPGGTTTAPDDTGATGFAWPDGLDVRVCADGTVEETDLQAAITLATGPIVIGVCPGSYGAIEVPSYADVTLIGPGPSLATIDGGDGTAVYVRSARLVLEGFTLTGTGRDLEWTTDLGGALTTQEGDVTVRDCVVAGVTGPYALVFDEEYLVMEDVVWEDNTTDWLWFLYQGTRATFTRNTVRGGTHHAVLATPDLTGLTLTNSTFSSITIDRASSAFDFAGDGEGTFLVANNVFSEVDDLEPWGGRLISGAADFRNNVVAGCDAWDVDPFPSAYSIFLDEHGDYEQLAVGPGNLSADPLLDGDLRPEPGSPAIDAGDPGDAWTDLDGTRNDMGAGGGPGAY